ncbi:hypothetical protein GF358_04475 [Candidatus Woesearchaeota archaeon]|nr:hypothetical protein [Candidatus Woesearchaeota archaeon]
MVFEQLLDTNRIKQNPFFILLLTFFYVLIAYGIAYLFFSSSVSVVAVFTLTLLLVPSLHHIVSVEEKTERKEGLKHFISNHRHFFKVFCFVFLGVILGLLAVSFFLPSELFSYQTDFLFRHRGLSLMQEFGSGVFNPSFGDALGLFTFNLEVALICLVLSVFYGAGAVFLIVLNATLFAGFFLFVVNNLSPKLPSLVLFVHFIPEIAGFLLAAMAGSVLSVAIMREHWGSSYFKNVVQNSLLMFVAGLAFIFFAAVLEVFVSAKVIHFVL